MPKKINITGDIISNDYAWIYDWMEWDYTCPRNVRKALDEAQGQDVEFLVNSPGGDVFAGYEIFNLIKAYKGHTRSNIIGLAASCGSFIPMAADEVVASVMSQMMIHGASTKTYGNQHNHQHTKDFLSKVDATIVKAYTSRNGKTDDEMLELMKNETWFTAEDMLEMGLIDEIINDTKASKPRVFNSIEGKQEIIDKLLAFGSPDNIKKALIENQLGQIGVTNTADNIPTNKKEENKMTLNELREKEPELYNEIVKEAKNEEKQRISAITDLAQTGMENIIKDGIEKDLSAGEVAINILNAQKKIGEVQLSNMQKDAENSGMNDIDSTTPQNTDQAKTTENKKAAFNALAEAAKKLTGGK